MTTLERLIDTLSKMPGLGKKSASRLAYYLLKVDQPFARGLAADIIALKEKVKSCPLCGNYTEEVPCAICTDPQRDRKTICVVEEPKDVHSIEATRQFFGLYHVLMGAISPIDGIGPDDLRIAQLCQRVREEEIVEVIIATNPPIEGDTTALFLNQRLKGNPSKISRLALGLPVGGDLEYADRYTLAKALAGRRQIEEE
ncbi:MAG TPA: recombination protein RecR, partial [bacterium]|nr:recombination protein RecR [bacterium]